MELDARRLGRDAGRIAEEVLSHPAGLPGANAEVTLENPSRSPRRRPRKRRPHRHRKLPHT